MLVDAETAGANGYPGLYGSIFWPSPQSVWGWPPPAAFESANYSIWVDEAAMAISLAGPVDPVTGLSSTKRFSLDLVQGSIVLEYVLSRADGGSSGSSTVPVAPWEITRVGPGGITFFPTAPATVHKIGGRTDFPVIPTTDASNATWFAQDPAAMNETGEKLFTEGCGGWIAQAVHSEEGSWSVLVKSCDAPPPGSGSACAGEGTLEVYAVPDYVEVETQGSCEVLKIGASRTWTCRWYARDLPSSCKAEVGNSALVGFADCLANCGGVD